ncbi:extracellular solute-binding protein [Kineococcus endophyticus]|uniref:Extracellular solute-binding protein n=1 Tax=Kineococcus endophyticus TaxID=1181883 RepID=A0ABV3PEH9_9ACTN
MKRTRALLAAGATSVLLLTACGGSGFDDQGSGGGQQTSGPAKLQVLIGSSGQAETNAVTQAADAWAKSAGDSVTVTAASDLNQQLAQGFASSNPPDVFYVGSDTVASYASNGSLLAYGDELKDKDDFYPNLRDAFTVDGEFYCAPKDFSTLALVIDEKAWQAAGLTDADVPTTWDQLASVAQRLTTGGRTGLVTSSEFQRLGVFAAQAGGSLVTDGKATASSAQMVQGLTYVKSLLANGSMKFAADVGAGDGTEALGTGKAAMTIEGNWIVGGVASSYPDLQYKVVKLPAGPAGPATFTYTNCWGIAADSKNQAAAKQLVEAMTSSDQQLTFAKAFGVMPSVQSAADGFRQQFPAQAAFIDSAADAQALPNEAGVSDVITDLNSKLEGLGTGDPQQILDATQQNLEAALK